MSALALSVWLDASDAMGAIAYMFLFAITFAVLNVALLGMMIVRLVVRTAEEPGDVDEPHPSGLIYASVLLFAASVLAMFIGFHFISSPTVLILDDVSLVASWGAVICGFFGRGRARGIALVGSTLVTMCWTVLVYFID